MQQFKFKTKPFCVFKRLGIQHTTLMCYFYGTFWHFGSLKALSTLVSHC